MEQVARGDRHSDTLRALGNRMIRLDLKLNDQQRKRISELLREINVGWVDEGNPPTGAAALLPQTTLATVFAGTLTRQ
jgi:hypothetical protein